MNRKIFFIITTLTFSYCIRENTLEPELNPGRRDYVWTVDTLDIYSPAYKIWGSSPTDVWTINRSDQNHSIWHYDGNKWSTDGIYRSVSPHAIWGFSEKDIFIGGTSGSIWHFDGSNWQHLITLIKDGTDYVAVGHIWGESRNELYAVGSGPDNEGLFNISAISLYNGNKWTNLNTGILKGFVGKLYKNIPDDKIFLRVTKIGGTKHIDSTLIYEYKSSGYYKIYGDIETRGLQADISLINNQVYFILGNCIAIRQKNKFITLFNVDSQNFYQRIWGRNSKDIFLLMTDGLAHYNGEDIEYLFRFTYANDLPWTQIFGAAIFEDEVFFTVYEPPTRLKLIYHGKLN